MEQKNQENTALSQKRYAIARCIKYIQLLLVVLIFFLPTLHFTEESKELKMEASSSFSVFQYIIGDTETKVQLKADGEKVSEDSLINSLLQINSVDVISELFEEKEDLILGFRLAPLVVGLALGIACAILAETFSLAERLRQKFQSGVQASSEIDQESKDKLNEVFNDQGYINQVYKTLPKFFHCLEEFLLGAIFTTYILLGFTALLQKMDAINFDWTVQLIYPIIATVVLIFLTKNCIVNWVCSKDINLIRSTGARFDGNYEFPTITSDIKVIGSLFQSNQAKILVAEDAKIDALQKYKTLLDQGVITEEEYANKKAELLNQKTDQT